MSYTAFKTDEGIEIRNGEDVITTVHTWPPRDPNGLDDLLKHAEISDPTRSVIRILFGVEELIDDREEMRQE